MSHFLVFYLFIPFLNRVCESLKISPKSMHTHTLELEEINHFFTKSNWLGGPRDNPGRWIKRELLCRCRFCKDFDMELF